MLTIGVDPPPYAGHLYQPFWTIKIRTCRQEGPKTAKIGDFWRYKYRPILTPSLTTRNVWASKSFRCYVSFGDMWSLCCLTLYYLSVRNLFEKWKRQTRTRILALSLLDATQKVEFFQFTYKVMSPSEAEHISITFQKLFLCQWISLS